MSYVTYCAALTCSYVNTAEITLSFNHLAIYNDNGY